MEATEVLSGLEIISQLVLVKLSGKIYFCSDKKLFWADKICNYVITLKKGLHPLSKYLSSSYSVQTNMAQYLAMFSKINIITLLRPTIASYRFYINSIFIQA